MKSNIRSLMRKAPESKEMDNPLLAERVTQKREPNSSSYRVPQDIILEQQHEREMDNLKSSHVNKSKTENPDELRKKKNGIEPPSEMNREKSNE